MINGTIYMDVCDDEELALIIEAMANRQDTHAERVRKLIHTIDIERAIRKKFEADKAKLQERLAEIFGLARLRV